MPVIWMGFEGGEAPTLDGEEVDEAESSLSGRNPALAKSPRVGRYAILRTIGSGGMGVVQAAYDEALDRKVAIKFIHEERSRQPKARQRMLREAQVMARLSHPSVVHVYEVAEHRRRLYIAMEYVDGLNLQQWLTQRPRGWREILDVFIGAGAGLAAAHRAGVVHRDFKPENVLIDRDGLAKVADFGVAGVDWELAETDGSVQTENSSLTATGALLGTPAYMAPEQYGGERSDALSDQFSFCVALYESLYGEHPFSGELVYELTRSISDGHRRPRPREQEVPRRVYAVLERGLRTDPERRYPSMEALLAALHRATRRRRPLHIAAVASVVTVGASAGLAFVGEADQPCRELPVAEDLWDAQTTQRVESSLFASDYAAAAATWERAEPKIARFADRWVELHADTCRARTEWQGDPAIFTQREQCLQRARFSFATRIEALAHADATTVERTAALVDGLPELSRCLDPAELTLRDRLAPPADLAPIIEGLERGAVEVRALIDAGANTKALARTDSLLPQAQATSYTPTLSQIRSLRASALEALGRFEESQRAAHQAYVEALQAGDDALAVRALKLSAAQLARRLQQPDEALEQIRVAEALLRRAGLEETPLRAAVWLELGWVQLRLDDNSGALQSMTRGLALLERLEGPGTRASHPFHYALGSLHQRTGELDEAHRYFEQLVALATEAYGPEHRSTARAESSLGEAKLAMGQVIEAAALLDHAAGILRQSRVDGQTPALARALSYLAMAEQTQGRSSPAVELFREAMEIDAKLYGADGTWTAVHETNLGIALRMDGHPTEALTHLRHALDVLSTTFGADNHRVAGVHLALGDTLLPLGKLEEADAELTRALELNETALGPDHPRNGEILVSLGRLRLQQADPQRACSALERARDLAAQSDPTTLLDARVALVEGWWMAGRERAAYDLARELLETTTASGSGPHAAAAHQTIRAWLDGHDEPRH